MTEFELVLLGCALFIAFFIVGCLIDKYREVANLQKAYDAKAEQCVVTYEAMLTLIREFNKEELELYLKDYSERLCDLYPEHNGNTRYGRPHLPVKEVPHKPFRQAG